MNRKKDMKSKNTYYSMFSLIIRLKSNNKLAGKNNNHRLVKMHTQDNKI